MQMAIKESVKQQVEEDGNFNDEEVSEEELLRRALEMSRPSNNAQENQVQGNGYEETIQLALEYGFDAEQAVQAISLMGYSSGGQVINSELVINYLMSMYGYGQGYSSGF